MSCVLITGATGVLGTALVPLFLQDGQAEVKLLVRADSGRHLQQRLDDLFAFWREDGAAPDWRQRVEVFQGDAAVPRWGLSEGDYRRLSEQVTLVIHAAGSVRLNQPLEQARRSAVASVRHVLEFVQASRDQGVFRKLELISTVGVAGRTHGLIREQPYQPERFHNTYEQAKAEAESIAWVAMSQGLPATIHRPSMVVGDSQTGRISRFQVFYYLTDFLSGLRTWGFVPETGQAKLDIIPVDCVARAIYLASQRQETAGRILHLCSGPERSWTISRLTVWLREQLAGRGQRLPRLRQVSPVTFRRALAAVRLVAPPKPRRFLGSLPYFLDYLAEEQLFDDRNADQFLTAAGCHTPAPEEYLEKVMERYWNRNA